MADISPQSCTSSCLHFPCSCPDSDTILRFPSEDIPVRRIDLCRKSTYFDSVQPWPRCFTFTDGHLVPATLALSTASAPTAEAETTHRLLRYLYDPSAIRLDTLSDGASLAIMIKLYGCTSHLRNSIVRRLQALPDYKSSMVRFPHVVLEIATELEDQSLFVDALRMVIARWRIVKSEMRGSALYEFCDQQYDNFAASSREVLFHPLLHIGDDSIIMSLLVHSCYRVLSQAVLDPGISTLEPIRSMSYETLMMPFHPSITLIERGLDAGDQFLSDTMWNDGDAEDNEDNHALQSEIEAAQELVNQDVCRHAIKRVVQAVKRSLHRFMHDEYPDVLQPHIDVECIPLPWLSNGESDDI